ncbi:MAG: class I SAM-dependent methyltransferase [Mycobacteriales bacterium]
MQERPASRTAVFVCQGRALADGRWATNHFRDPVAHSMLRHAEVAEVERALAPQPPDDWRAGNRARAIEACAEAVVPRTVAIDRAIEEAAHQQVVILGLGLDSRPYRLPALGDAVVYAVDHPASLADSTERAEGLPVVARQLVRIAVDLAESDLGSPLLQAGYSMVTPTTWVWEGVVPYLTTRAVREVVHTIAALSAAGSRLVINYQAASSIAVIGRYAGEAYARLAKLEDPFAGEPWRSFWRPRNMRRVLERSGFAVESDTDMLGVAQRIGSPATHVRSVANGRVVVARRTATGDRA